MLSLEGLAELIRSIGFSCTGCGVCCRQTDSDPGTVLVSCAEVREIIARTNLPWDDVTRPYPESIRDGNGGRYTLCWCLRQDRGACRFHDGESCTIYACRPWICRTYPFTLHDGGIAVSDCPGLGRQVSGDAALQIARDLIHRHAAEEEEIRLVREALAKNRIPAGSFVVIDSEGMKVIDG